VWFLYLMTLFFSGRSCAVTIWLLSRESKLEDAPRPDANAHEECFSSCQIPGGSSESVQSPPPRTCFPSATCSGSQAVLRSLRPSVLLLEGRFRRPGQVPQGTQTLCIGWKLGRLWEPLRNSVSSSFHQPNWPYQFPIPKYISLFFKQREHDTCLSPTGTSCDAWNHW